MDESQYDYLRLNKYLLSIIGLWPLHSASKRIPVIVLFSSVVVAQAVLQGGGIITALYNADMDAGMEGFSPFLISFMCLCKLVNCILNYQQMTDLFRTMCGDWDLYSKSAIELSLLRRNYELGRRLTVTYAALLYGTMVPFSAVPTVLTAADVLGFYNASGERPLVFRVEHFVDTEKYYYALLVHSYFGTMGFVTLVIAIDSMIVVYVQHGCAICDILGHRVEQFLEDDRMTMELHPKRTRDEAYQNVRDCIILHNHIIKYAKKLENANTTSYLVQMGLNMTGISFTLFQVVMKLENPNDAARYVLFYVCLLSVVFVESWPGQQLSDHTEQIFQHTMNGKWYQASLDARKLLIIMMLKCLKPLKLTAGKLYVLNMQSFGAIVRTSFSYFTLLRSMQ